MANILTPDTVTAAMLAIGDELLSGRTKDKNIVHLAGVMTLKGIDLKEVRIVADEEAAIVEALNALRSRYTHVFTSGGIGPTHDDITADAVARAFGVAIGHDRRAMKLLGDHYAARGLDFTDARKRMARIPEGAELIDNPVSIAPGFTIGNVHVMAGVPSIFQAMLDTISPALEGGARLISKSVECSFGEGDIGAPLAAVQQAHGETAIGSYPRFDGKSYSTEIVIRGRDEAAVLSAEKAVRDMLAAL
ncbi:competence/damage-inducible protein A [Salaquimonas pukyongi]|uniref:competence/damage-inducible protein A n=1 Tax=Salaquimonas pukyongi TaxID=2712698 RepID=UPI00096BCD8F|nr:competence/damage-inducible protein A [Salaquimonas pukyongi]